ncbi:hypothetical protein GF412_02275 [Candidatus Micrarchaeota archaeon]|nr:hypothetical protein [Candidatus Micrarchaeota archaeon]MBD3417788.1 hypothetical protein [Candidatus Micrarchaeota archaeon]
MSPKRALKKPSTMQVEAIVQAKWPYAKMCRRYLSEALDAHRYNALVKRSEEASRKLLPPKAISWSSLEKARDIPCSRNLSKHRIEFAGDLYTGTTLIVGGYRFNAGTYASSEVSLNIRKPGRKKGKSVHLNLSKNQTVEVTDGGKTLTIGFYGRCEDYSVIGLYIKVE